jgi:membrane protein YqaA with SNARE-associated domain
MGDKIAFAFEVILHVIGQVTDALQRLKVLFAKFAIVANKLGGVILWAMDRTVGGSSAMAPQKRQGRQAFLAENVRYWEDLVRRIRAPRRVC